MAAWGARLVSEASVSLRAFAGWLGCGVPSSKGAAATEAAARTENVPKERDIDLGHGVKLDLVLLPAGSFRMGSEKGARDEMPVHEVRLARPFYMAKYQVTQEQWRAVMGSNPSHFQDPKDPVERVSWHRCHEFLKRLGEKTGRKFALPSEAEWEYACRAGSTAEFCFGEEEDGLGEYAWYAKNSRSQTHPVGQKRPNAWGLYDLHGNVWEWCEDVYHTSYAGAPADGSPWLHGRVQSFRVLRGGSWVEFPRSCRSAARYRNEPGDEWVTDGFRVVLRDY